MISCEVNGQLVYITKFRDFEDCMDHSVFRAIKQFFGVDETESENYIERISELESTVCDLESGVETAEYGEREAVDRAEEFEKENEQLKEKILQIKENISKINEIMEE